MLTPEMQPTVPTPETTPIPPSPPKRKVIRSNSPNYMRGAQDLVERHPLRDEIDRAILSKEASADALAARYEFSGAWVIYRRKKTLVKRMAARARKDTKSLKIHADGVQEKRTLRMLSQVQDASMQGFQKIMDISESASDVERSATFLDKYLKSVELYGHATGEIPIGGINPAVNVDNRQLYVMSMPRLSDPQSVIDASEQMIRNLGPGAALPQSGKAVIDLEVEDDLDDDEG